MTHTHAHTQLFPTQKDLAKVTSPWTFLEHSASNHSSFQYSCQFWPEKASFNSEFAALSLVRGGTCDICTDTLEIILHVIVAQIGGQRRCRQGTVARDTEEMFNHGPAHSGASLFSLSSLWFISLFVLSLSLSLPTAAGLPLGGSCIMAGLIYWLISSH